MKSSERAGEVFYVKLFGLRPQLRALFGQDIKQQQSRLILMFDSAVKSVEYLDEMGEQFQHLGQRHAGYGVTAQDFPYMESALLSMLSEILGDDWNSELQDAWLWLFAEVEAMMLSRPVNGHANPARN